MIVKDYQFDLLTRMFAEGANPMEPEIRAPEIRGVLRWWFRVLGGFRGDTRSVRDQELALFGGVFGDKPTRSKLVVRALKHTSLVPFHNDAEGLDAGVNTALGYLLFPMRGVQRGFFQPNKPQNEAFRVSLVWNGAEEDFVKIDALMAVFGQLGSLGFRSRKCMGALAFHGKPPMRIDEALEFFANPQAIDVHELPENQAGEPLTSVEKCVKGLAVWYKQWRSYGPEGGRNTFAPGFEKASIDHDIGLGDRRGESAVRPALGLPIIQRYSHVRMTNTWNPSDGDRFASPVILRPYRTAQGGFKALVVFVDAMKWSEGATVKIGPKVVPVSNELYMCMKEDTRLRRAQLD